MKYTVRGYAQEKGITTQRVYQMIKDKKLKTEREEISQILLIVTEDHDQI